MVPFFESDFLHGINNCRFLIFIKIRKQDGISNETDDKNLWLLSFGDAPELDLILFVKVAEHFLRDSHTTSFFCFLFFLDDPWLLLDTFTVTEFRSWVEWLACSLSCDRVKIYWDNLVATWQHRPQDQSASSWQFHRSWVARRCWHSSLSSLWFIFFCLVGELLFQFPTFKYFL